ncbi:prepilin-type N-terminal cleavage/methylation domain-containing protein [Crateriforma conspicua]|nr:prepilin-type N-terminal cleavage/methylation domain-containing protein [Crateriforma conspicua]
MKILKDHRGFTLIELVVVLILVGLVAGIAIGSTRGLIRKATTERWIESFLLTEQIERHEAAKLNRSGGIILGSNRDLTFIAADRHLAIPPGLQLERWQVLEAAEMRPSDNRVPYFANGQSRTHLMELRCGDVTEWVLVMGLSGQVRHLRSQSQLEAVLSTLRSDHTLDAVPTERFQR